MTDSEVINQMISFLFAAQDTTSLTLSYLLHHLSHSPSSQSTLRAELFSLSSSLPPGAAHPSLSDLSSLPYLHAVLNETLRMSPALTSTVRIATRSTVLLLSTPIVNNRDPSQPPMRELPIRKGTKIHIPSEFMNRRRDIWGDEAAVWKPERWLEEGFVKGVKERSGGVGSEGLMTFLDGKRRCVGSRLAVAE
jgi:cytochrome P450